jgi:hypothetical protein
MGEIIGSVNIVLAYLFYRIAGTPPSASVQLPKASKTSVTLSELAVEYQGEFTAKGFPRPFPFPSSQTQDNPPNNALTSKLSATSCPPAALQYTRNLAGITGVVTQAGAEFLGMAPTGLGEGVDRYLDAHGYDSASRLYIMHARREFGMQDFVSYLCGKGMVMSEVVWLWQLLVEHC